MTPGKQDSGGADLDPGITKTVALLRAWGYDTTDSGDGRSKFEAGTADETTLREPHVYVRVEDKGELLGEADRLWGLLLREVPESGATVRVEATYWPEVGVSVIRVFGLEDSML